MKSKGKEVTAEVLAFRMNWSNEQDELLQEQEGVIENGRAAFEKVASALAIIKEKELFLLTHTSFKSYCEERWGFTEQWAYRLLRATEADKLLEATKVTLARKDQKAVSALQEAGLDARAEVADLSKREVTRVARKVAKVTNNEPPTTQQVKRAVAEVTHQEPTQTTPLEDPESTKTISDLLKKIANLEAQLANQPVKPKLSVAKAPVAAEHPVLIALDNAWAGMTRGMAYTNPTPLMVYKALRNAVEKVL